MHDIFFYCCTAYVVMSWNKSSKFKNHFMAICLAASATGHRMYDRRLFCKYFDNAPKINVAFVSQKKVVQNHKNRHV
jgi:hypothetical protein